MGALFGFVALGSVLCLFAWIWDKAQTAIIVGLDYDADLVTVCAVGGNVWQFYGCEDYAPGDLVRMLMWDAETPNSIYDDEIVTVWYAGTLEQFAEIL